MAFQTYFGGARDRVITRVRVKARVRSINVDEVICRR